MTVGIHLAVSRSRLAIALCSLALAMGAGAGCSALNKHHAAAIPHPGIIDPNQPGELRMVSMPPYVVEPPDELEVTVRPSVGDLSAKSLVVQPDGVLDLGFGGDVFVAGLTLDQIEQKISKQLTDRGGGKERYEASVRLVNGTQSKFYYVLGTVTNQGKFPLKGKETVLEAILTAGLKVNSVPEKACLVRPHPTGGPDQVLQIDWIGIRERGDTLTNYQIFPGDRILVPGTKPPGLLTTLFGG
jgi:polysaccharide export outer membrane protein